MNNLIPPGTYTGKLHLFSSSYTNTPTYSRPSWMKDRSLTFLVDVAAQTQQGLQGNIYKPMKNYKNLDCHASYFRQKDLLSSEKLWSFLVKSILSFFFCHAINNVLLYLHSRSFESTHHLVQMLTSFTFYVPWRLKCKLQKWIERWFCFAAA